MLKRESTSEAEARALYQAGFDPVKMNLYWRLRKHPKLEMTLGGA